MKSKKINITLVRSLIGRQPRHVQYAKQLGLSKIGKSVQHENNPAIMGLVNKIEYMLKVEESLS